MSIRNDQNLIPETVEELIERAESLAGFSLQALAERSSQTIPQDLTHAKGWSGQLIESLLGTSAGNASLPDFLNLGIELKTIPIQANGSPYESTFVCSIPLLEIALTPWRESNVYKKLKSVLWIPIVTEAKTPISERIVGSPYLYHLPPDDESVIQTDWEEFAEQIGFGHVENISAKQGNYLQVRPKAANSKIRTKALNSDGEVIETLPRGFYLRPRFTEKIFARYYSF